MANNTDQLNMKDYQFKEVKVRMYLKEGDTLYSQDPVNTSNAAVSLMREYLKDFDREAVCTLNLDSKMKPINFNIVSLGDLNSSIIHPREVFKSAILSNAAAVIMFHNHPSGDVTPSNQDIDATRRIAEAGQILGINLLDHVIAAGGKQSYFSFSNSMTELLHGPVHTDSIPQSIKAKEEEPLFEVDIEEKGSGVPFRYPDWTQEIYNNERSTGMAEKDRETLLTERIIDFYEKYDSAFGYAEGVEGQENREQWIETIKGGLQEQSLYTHLLDLSRDNREAREEAISIYTSYPDITGYTPTENRYYEPELDLDGTAEELFIQARNGYKGGKTIMEERKDREKDQAGERKKVYITLNKAFCYQRESETTGRIYNQMIMPKGTLLDGRDIGGYKIAPAYMEQSKYNPNEMVATYYVPADKPLKVKLIKGADFEEVDIEKIKEAVDDQKDFKLLLFLIKQAAYREALKEKEKEEAAEKAPKSVLRKEKDRGEEL